MQTDHDHLGCGADRQVPSERSALGVPSSEMFIYGTRPVAASKSSSSAFVSNSHARPSTMIPRPPRYIPLPTPASWSIPARYTVWWRRKAVRGSTLAVATILVVAILRYWSCLLDYLNGDSGDETAGQFDPSLDAAYVPFKPSRPPPTSDTVALKPSTELPSSCIDAHFARGELCYNPQVPRLDVVWTWVNGSDILFKDALAKVENSLAADDPYRPTKSFLKVRQFR